MSSRAQSPMHRRRWLERGPKRTRSSREERQPVLVARAREPPQVCSPCSCRRSRRRHQHGRLSRSRRPRDIARQLRRADAQHCRGARWRAYPSERSQACLPTETPGLLPHVEKASKQARAAPTPGSRSDARGKPPRRHPEKRSDTSAAACTASLVLPVPPGPGERQERGRRRGSAAPPTSRELVLTPEERRGRHGQVRSGTGSSAPGSRRPRAGTRAPPRPDP